MARFKIQDDTGIKKLSSNGGRSQKLLLEYNDNIYKIQICSESHEKQSFGKLSLLNNQNDWTILKVINPKGDYDIDIAYKNNYLKNVFKPIIDDFKKLIKKLSPTIAKEKLSLENLSIVDIMNHLEVAHNALKELSKTDKESQPK